jgi:hypothetical protein
VRFVNAFARVILAKKTTGRAPYPPRPFRGIVVIDQVFSTTFKGGPAA